MYSFVLLGAAKAPPRLQLRTRKIEGPGGPGTGYNGNPSRRLRTLPLQAGRRRNALARLGAGFSVKNHLKPLQRLPGALTNVGGPEGLPTFMPRARAYGGL